MNAKRPSLAENMRAVAETPDIPTPAREPPTPVTSRRALEATGMMQIRPKAFYSATREGKKKATATLSNEGHRQLKLLAVDHGGVEKLLTEAINDLFRKYGKPPIA